MAKYVFNPFTGKLDTSIDEATITNNITAASGGYEFTAGFTDRDTTGGGSSDVGTNVSYTQAEVDAQAWRRFGFDSARQIANDTPYWGNGPDPNEAPHSGTTDYQGVGLFSGAYMPEGVTQLFDFTADQGAYSLQETAGANPYNAAAGSLDFTQCQVGDFFVGRFDFNLVPQFPNTTVEVGLIWSTRDGDDNITFTFPLTTQPIFLGTGAGTTFLCRPIITAYFASQEDVNARALPAIRADQPILVQPLTFLSGLRR
jgi:hypothetical protein